VGVAEKNERENRIDFLGFPGSAAVLISTWSGDTSSTPSYFSEWRKKMTPRLCVRSGTLGRADLGWLAGPNDWAARPGKFFPFISFLFSILFSFLFIFYFEFH
jgi:hypothetical protein